jgi:hypothetical protein
MFLSLVLCLCFPLLSFASFAADWVRFIMLDILGRECISHNGSYSESFTRSYGTDVSTSTPKFETKSAFVLLQCMNARGEWSYSVTHSLPRHQVRVNGRIHFYPWKGHHPSVPAECVAWHLPLPFRTLRDTRLGLIGSRFLGCAACSVVTKHSPSSSEILSSLSNSL